MRIIADFGSDKDYNDDFSWIRDSMHCVYHLRAWGDGCPEKLNLFYIGVTNNPVARLMEHMFVPHSGAMLAMMTACRVYNWQVEMQIDEIFQSRSEAEEEESSQIAFYSRKNSGFQLMNMEGMLEPVCKWIEDQMVSPDAKSKEPYHDEHVVEFRKQA